MYSFSIVVTNMWYLFYLLVQAECIISNSTVFLILITSFNFQLLDFFLFLR